MPALCLAWPFPAQPRKQVGTRPRTSPGVPWTVLSAACPYHQQQSWLLPLALPSAGTRSPAPELPAAACPGRTSPGTAGDRRCQASARHSHTRDLRDRAQQPRHSLHAAARHPLRRHPQPSPRLPSPGHLLPPHSARTHQQQAVAVVEVKHQGLIQELVAGAQGVGTGLRAAAQAHVICPCLSSARDPAAAPGSASPPASEEEMKTAGQCGKPGPDPSPPTGSEFL